MQRRLRIALRQSEICQQDRHLRHKDAVRMLGGEAAEHDLRLGKLVGLHLRLRGQIGGVVVQGVARRIGMGQRGDGFRKTAIEQVCMAEREIGCSGSIAGMRLCVVGHAGISGGSAVLRQLLRHGAELGRGHEGALQPAAAGN